MKITYIGISHLSIIYGLSSALKNHNILFVETDDYDLNLYKNGNFPFFEKELLEVYEKVRSNVLFTKNLNEIVDSDLIFISKDIKKLDEQNWDYDEINLLISKIYPFLINKIPVIIQSQSFPGYIRNLRENWKIDFIYFVETLIIGNSFENALSPSRTIIGKVQDSFLLPDSFKEFLKSFDTQVIETTYETAELIKIAVNVYLIFDVTATNLLSSIGATHKIDWEKLVYALRLDPRIGINRYLSPGFGISGGNLERDLKAIINLGSNANLPIRDLIENINRFSEYNKIWPFQKFLEFLDKKKTSQNILIIGLGYKSGTSSTINSPSIKLVESLNTLKLNINLNLIFFDENNSDYLTDNFALKLSKLNLDDDLNFDFIFYMYHSEKNAKILNKAISSSYQPIVIGKELNFLIEARQKCILINK